MKLVNVLEILKNGEFEKIERNQDFNFRYDVILNSGGKIRVSYHPYMLRQGGDYRVLLFVPEEEKSIANWWIDKKHDSFKEVEQLYK